MTTKTKSSVAQPIFASLRDRLNAGREAAEVAWAGKASAGLRETVVTLGAVVRSFDVRAPEIQNKEDLLRSVPSLPRPFGQPPPPSHLGPRSSRTRPPH